ncbi:hypothetical protein Bca4012_060307 [Brassica carinata]|uniref:Uncharacterized protein n=1 Tax=Brassica carinata TaxID=52824 RepID=A0A8X7S955_BRACI|nr:hypothetical protein Bca52824_030623 [Brassica carinata]
MEKRLDHTRIHRSKIKQLSILFEKLHLSLIQIHPSFDPTPFLRVEKRHNVLLPNRRKRKPNRFPPTEINFVQTEPARALTKDHYDELFGLLDVDDNVEQSTQKPRFYHRGGDSSCLSCDDDRELDIEMCPKCQNSRLVYDCPAEDCKGKEECRACSLCIQRCFQCGRCINDSEYEETFCLEFLCADCSKQSPKLPL